MGELSRNLVVARNYNIEIEMKDIITINTLAKALENQGFIFLIKALSSFKGTKNAVGCSV
eukprot:scaffold143157_cov22-Tisochrysis_lutea.AAC.1